VGGWVAWMEGGVGGWRAGGRCDVCGGGVWAVGGQAPRWAPPPLQGPPYPPLRAYQRGVDVDHVQGSGRFSRLRQVLNVLVALRRLGQRAANGLGAHAEHLRGGTVQRQWAVESVWSACGARVGCARWSVSSVHLYVHAAGPEGEGGVFSGW
jgi:hypothetical protein